MALEANIGGDDDDLFIGEDKTIRLEVLDADGIPVNIAGWTLHLDVKLIDRAEDPSLLLLVGSVTGTYNASRTVNTQRCLFIVSDDDLDGDDITGRKYRYSTKRTDAGDETVITFGNFEPRWAPSR